MNGTAPVHAERLVSGALPELAAALDGAGLPSADIGLPGRAFFRFSDQGGAVGFGGLEGAAPDMLLRSLVVAPGHRRKGQGGRILRALEAQAGALGCARLHLLTDTAEAFFLRHGFQAAARQAPAPAIAESAEFETLCPASARYLVKEPPA